MANKKKMPYIGDQKPVSEEKTKQQQDAEDITGTFAEGLPADKALDLQLGAGASDQILGAGSDQAGGAIHTGSLGRIGEKEIAEAQQTLQDYKAGKANLEQRIVDDELWWKLRHWDVIRGKREPGDIRVEPTSAWLFNGIVNKHADAMDNYPESVVLPRERSDEESAKALSSILPVVMEANDFETVYSDNWYEKLKHGTGVYGVFWNPAKDGLGDIDIMPIDLLKIFYEPGCTDIQKSRNLFICELIDTDLLEAQYPEYKGQLGGNVTDVKQYVYDDSIDVSDKSVVVDWYYKTQTESGKPILHYVKYCGNKVLFATENEEQYAAVGWYRHGLYPVIFDGLFPEKGTPVGFGYVTIGKDPQLYIDKLSGNILENSMMGTKKRFFASSSLNINEDEFLDWSRPIIHVEGEIDDRRLKELSVNGLDGIYTNVLQMKIDELKDTTSNRDVNSGGSGGQTTAAGIAALQEAGNKVSRDMINGSYRAFRLICEQVIELMRQFYDETRCFRILGENGNGYEFMDFDNQQIKPQQTGIDMMGNPLLREPVFDLKIKPVKKNPFSRIEQNELAKELYSMGFFNPERAQEALPALDMMEFEGADKVREQVQQGQTLLNICQQLSQQVEQLTAMMQASMGMAMPAAPAEPGDPGGDPGGEAPAENGDRVKSNSPQTGLVQSARSNLMTPYGNRLAKSAKPDMNSQGGKLGGMGI